MTDKKKIKTENSCVAHMADTLQRILRRVIVTGNSFGQLFRVTSFGESHGIALGCIIDGCPPALPLSEEEIQAAVNERRSGLSPVTSPRLEPDKVQILSGVFNGMTTGTPISLVIMNEDARSSDYTAIQDQFRPGHADYTYYHKYGIRDFRGGGRASARETVMRVAAGAVAKKYLKEHLGMNIRGCLKQLGHRVLPINDWDAVKKNPFFCADPSIVPTLLADIEALKQKKDSTGGLIYVEAHPVPIGLGEPVFDKLNACIAHAMMSINAVKSVEIGDGFHAVYSQGSQFRDELSQKGFLSNHAGGILGGISNGQPISVTVGFKPTSSIAQPARSLNEKGEEITLKVEGRHDPCVAIRAVPIVEAMLALVLMDHYLRFKAQCL